MARFEDNVELVDEHLLSPNSETFVDARVFSPLAATEYSRRARIVNRLRDLGVDRLELPGIDGEEFDISLPKIVLVGNQSSGKSSLIEAISQIKVPRDDDTCTRCPIEVRLCGQGGVEWNCTVSLRRCLPNGNNQVLEFANASDRDAVESILRRAQRAILNPSLNSDVFRSDNLSDQPDTDELTFSEDTVIVEIVGMNMDITFIDLPGLISSVPSLLVLKRLTI
jgi:hypothetical protein